MRTLLCAVLVAVFVSSATAHEGAISLYLDETITDCDAYINAFETQPVNVYYIRHHGPELGKGVEFMVLITTPDALFSPPPVWSSAISLIIGDIQSGISMVSPTCMGVGQDVVYLGRLSVLSLMMSPATFYMGIMPHPATGAISITLCDANNTIASVLGGAFVFNGKCNVATDETSWGAIKSLYR